MTVVLAERDAEEAAAFSDRIVLMKGGRVIGSGLPREVLKDPDKLRNIGVAPPQMSEVAALLNARLRISKYSFLTVGEAERAIADDILTRAKVMAR
jgi:energy-coupling factor transporter ATP-binding protein EcfA2